jgi:hypothetical protein
MQCGKFFSRGTGNVLFSTAPKTILELPRFLFYGKAVIPFRK